MATEDFLSCLSRAALEAVAETAVVAGRIKVKDSRGAVVEDFADDRLILPVAAIAPDAAEVRALASRYSSATSDLEEDDETPPVTDDVEPASDLSGDDGADDFREAAE